MLIRMLVIYVAVHVLGFPYICALGYVVKVIVDQSLIIE